MDRDPTVHRRTRGRPRTLSANGVKIAYIYVGMPEQLKERIFSRADDLGISINEYIRNLAGMDTATDHTLENLEKEFEGITVKSEFIQKQIIEEKARQQRKATEEKTNEELMVSAVRHIYDNLVEHGMRYRNLTPGSPRLERVLTNIAENITLKYKILVTVNHLKIVLDKMAAADGKKIIWTPTEKGAIY